MTGRDFEVHSLGDRCQTVLLRVMQGDPPIVRFAKQVAWADDEKLAVGGTDRGRANVYDTASGCLVGYLDHPAEGLVQTLDVCGTVIRLCVFTSPILSGHQHSFSQLHCVGWDRSRRAVTGDGVA